MKDYIYIALIIAGIAFWQWDRHQAKEAGFNECQIEVTKHNNEVIQDITTKQKAELAAAQSELSKARLESNTWKITAQELANVKPKTIPTPIIHVNRPTTNNCPDPIDNDVISMFNDYGNLYREQSSIIDKHRNK